MRIRSCPPAVLARRPSALTSRIRIPRPRLAAAAFVAPTTADTALGRTFSRKPAHGPLDRQVRTAACDRRLVALCSSAVCSATSSSAVTGRRTVGKRIREVEAEPAAAG